LEQFLSAWLLPLSGVVIGVPMGFVARSNHFCTLAALERYWYVGDGRGARAWALAAAIALLATLILRATGVIDLSRSFYLTEPVPIAGSIIGGLMFGVGMALVGTCGFGALVRMGGGNLRALVVLTGVALAAIAAQRGITAHFRQWLLDPLSVDLSKIGGATAGTLLNVPAGLSPGLSFGAVVVIAIMIWVWRDPAFRKDHGKIIAGCVIGLAISAGWLVTSTMSADSFRNIQLEAGSFVAPLGDTMMQIITVTGALPDYGVGLVLGVFLGAVAAAWRADDMRWEACDDARELGRHLAGAFLMGTGGVFALGCTIGQGVSAVSVLAVSAPLALGSIILGARIGLSWLIEGSAFGFLSASGKASLPAE
jgi:uncharacterized membrane protein YedE/YeeE